MIFHPLFFCFFRKVTYDRQLEPMTIANRFSQLLARGGGCRDNRVQSKTDALFEIACIPILMDDTGRFTQVRRSMPILSRLKGQILKRVLCNSPASIRIARCEKPLPKMKKPPFAVF